MWICDCSVMIINITNLPISWLVPMGFLFYFQVLGLPVYGAIKNMSCQSCRINMAHIYSEYIHAYISGIYSVEVVSICLAMYCVFRYRYVRRHLRLKTVPRKWPSEWGWRRISFVWTFTFSAQTRTHSRKKHGSGPQMALVAWITLLTRKLYCALSPRRYV